MSAAAGSPTPMAHEPGVRYEGYVYKRLKRLDVPLLGPLLAWVGRGWGKRYVRLLPGKLEWYLSDSEEHLAKPLGSVPIAAASSGAEGGAVKCTMSTSMSSEATCPVKTRSSDGLNCLKLRFDEATRAQDYYMCPIVDDAANLHEEIYKFEQLCDKSGLEAIIWSKEQFEAAFQRLRNAVK